MKNLFLFFISLIFASCAIVKIEKREVLNYSGEYKTANYYFEIKEYEKCLEKVNFILSKLISNKDKLIAEYDKCKKMFGDDKKFCVNERIQIEDLEEWEKKLNELKKNVQQEIIK